jgi:hypothetical protein
VLEPNKVAEELRRVAGPRGRSCFVNEAVRRQLQALRLGKLLDEMKDEADPILEGGQREVDSLDWPA